MKERREGRKEEKEGEEKEGGTERRKGGREGGEIKKQQQTLPPINWSPWLRWEGCHGFPDCRERKNKSSAFLPGRLLTALCPSLCRMGPWAAAALQAVCWTSFLHPAVSVLTVLAWEDCPWTPKPAEPFLYRHMAQCGCHHLSGSFFSTEL